MLFGIITTMCKWKLCVNIFTHIYSHFAEVLGGEWGKRQWIKAWRRFSESHPVVGESLLFFSFFPFFFFLSSCFFFQNNYFSFWYANPSLSLSLTPPTFYSHHPSGGAIHSSEMVTHGKLILENNSSILFRNHLCFVSKERFNNSN